METKSRGETGLLRTPPPSPPSPLPSVLYPSLLSYLVRQASCVGCRGRQQQREVIHRSAAFARRIALPTMRYHNKQYCKCCVGLCYECASCVASHTDVGTNSLAKESRSHGYTKVRNRIPPPNGNRTHLTRQKFEPATKRYVLARLIAGLKYASAASRSSLLLTLLATEDLSLNHPGRESVLPFTCSNTT